MVIFGTRAFARETGEGDLISVGRIAILRFLSFISLFQLDNVGDVIEKIRIGHDNKGMTPGWHLDRVEVRRLKDDGETSTTYTFPCKRWLAKDEDDGSVVRELIPNRVVEETVTEDGELETREVDHETLEREYASVSVKTQILLTHVKELRHGRNIL